LLSWPVGRLGERENRAPVLVDADRLLHRVPGNEQPVQRRRVNDVDRPDRCRWRGRGHANLLVWRVWARARVMGDHRRGAGSGYHGGEPPSAVTTTIGTGRPNSAAWRHVTLSRCDKALLEV